MLKYYTRIAHRANEEHFPQSPDTQQCFTSKNQCDGHNSENRTAEMELYRPCS